MTTSKNVYEETEKQLFISTGCDLLDKAAGGGIPRGKITQLYGDSASGKSLLAAEIAANFVHTNENPAVFWLDAENACDPNYLNTLGLNPNSIIFADSDGVTDKIPDASNTVEGLYQLIVEMAIPTALEGGRPSLVIVDSLDALSDRAEIEREIDAGSYGMSKQKKLSEMLRRITAEMGKADVTLVFLSQVRANVTGMGEASLPSGGKAVGFYATLRVKLARIKRLNKTVKGIKRDYGQVTRYTIKKTRYSMPHREVDAILLFSYGVCNATTNMNFLAACKSIPAKALEALGMKNTPVGHSNFTSRVRYSDTKEAEKACKLLTKEACKAWDVIEKGFTPKRAKYGN